MFMKFREITNYSAYLYLNWILFLTTLFVCFLSLTPLAKAQEVGVSITPATIEETIDPGVEKQYSISVENLNSSEQTFYLFTRNISGVRDGGVPVFAPDNFERTGFELTDWIILPVNELQLPGNGKTNFDFTLKVPENATPGSHFGGIFISVEPPKIENSGAAVGYQVANIVSIRVSGDALEQANIRQFSTDKFFYGSPNVEFLVRIENTGNVMIRPSGPLEIYNMFGKKVDSVIFNNENDEPKAVLPIKPDNFRDFTLKWEGTGTAFGRYEAILSPVFGEQGAKKTISNTVSFWVLPMNIIGPSLGVLAVVLLFIFVFVKLYIRRSLAHLNVGRRIIGRRRKNGPSVALLLTIVMLTVTALFLIVLLALFA
jgi:hypothetical protein